MSYNVLGKNTTKTFCRFLPSGKAADLRSYYAAACGNVIVVPSLQQDNNFEYRFVDVLDFEEFLAAVTYVMVYDSKHSGVLSVLARDYIPVYQHRQYNYIRRYLARPRCLTC